jgi:hypothetical protein
MIIEKKKISELKAAPYNPRKSTEKQESQLKASLEKFGVVEPIIWNKQSGYIVGGHFRIRELKKLGYKEVECVIVDLNEEDERELNIRLNANTGEWNWDELSNDWDAEKLEDWGLDVPTFRNGDEIDGVGDFDDPGITARNQYGVIVICESEGTQESVFNDLTNMGFNCKIVVT